MIRTTAEQSGFEVRFVEKDYYCSLLLSCLCGTASPLVFKGGTCISKVFTSFYRLSEDLDFCVPVKDSDARLARRKKINPLKVLVNDLARRVTGIKIIETLTGQNESTQYVARIGYLSAITQHDETIQVEIGLREPLMLPVETRPALTLLRDAFSGKAALPPFPINVINEREAWAEKVRAALTRREPAIRDFFDLDYARENLGLSLQDKQFLALVQRKVAVPGNHPVHLSAQHRMELVRQVEAQLRPVLRAQDFERFDLDRIWTALTELLATIEPPVRPQAPRSRLNP